MPVRVGNRATELTTCSPWQPAQVSGTMAPCFRLPEPMRAKIWGVRAIRVAVFLGVAARSPARCWRSDQSPCKGSPATSGIVLLNSSQDEEPANRERLTRYLAYNDKATNFAPR